MICCWKCFCFLLYRYYCLCPLELTVLLFFSERMNMSFERFVGISVNMHTKEPVDFSSTCYLIPRRSVGVLSRRGNCGSARRFGRAPTAPRGQQPVSFTHLSLDHLSTKEKNGDVDSRLNVYKWKCTVEFVSPFSRCDADTKPSRHFDPAGASVEQPSLVGRQEARGTNWRFIHSGYGSQNYLYNQFY